MINRLSAESGVARSAGIGCRSTQSAMPVAKEFIHRMS